MSRHKNTLILTIDGLGSRDPGAYGNTWIETPAFDRLASRSLLFEHVLANSTQPDLALASMATGLNAAASVGQPHSVLETIRKQGIPTILFSDSQQPFPEAMSESSFERRVFVEANFSDRSVADWEQTHCANFFAQLMEVRRTLPKPHLLWAHFAGLTSCWDAPYSWRERMVDEGDPEPPTWTRPPQAVWSDRDPDEQLQLYQAFGAEVMVLDACLDPLFDDLMNESQVTFLLTSPRGYPLGEHGIVGLETPTLYSESTSVPLLVTDFSDSVGWRSQDLVQPSLIAEFVRRAYLETSGANASQQRLADVAQANSRAVCLTNRASALRTDQWLLIQKPERRELYVKPDDRWEFNDVSSRCAEIVEQLGAEISGQTSAAEESV